MRLIDADAFDKMLIEAQAKCKKDGGNFRFGVLGNVRANLALFPAVDRPEIVRCKDCKHKVNTVDDYGYESKCPCFCSEDGYYSWVPDDDWFCPRGERRS